MNRKVFCLFALLFALISTWAVQAQDGELVPIIFGEKIPGVPKRGEALEEREAALAEAVGLWPWEANPALYGFTSPPSVAIIYLSEGESTSGVILGWPTYGARFPEITEIIRAGVQQGVQVTVVVPTSVRASAQATLTSRGVDISQVEFVTLPIDTIWLRDYGPDFMYGADGAFHVMDLSYYPQKWPSPTQPRGRVNDDAMPTRLASVWGYNVYRPPFAMEGGNIQSDGAGTCFASSRIVEVNRLYFGYSEQRIREILAQYYSCQELVILEQLGPDPYTTCREGTGHIDMWMTFVYPNNILVGQIDPSDDPGNAARLNRNAATLSALTDGDGNPRYNVVRIPMPKRYYIRYSPPNCIRSCATQPDPCVDRVWATYANSTQVGNAMLVPIYRRLPPALRDTILAQERQALDTYKEIAIGLQVVTINADTIIPYDGAIHCVDKTYFIQ